MSTESALIRVSAWLAFLLYIFGEAALVLRASRKGHLWLGGAGLALLIVHFGLAFHFRYHWSHAAAYDDTARQTLAATGWNSGAGVYVNYGFALVWLGHLARCRKLGNGEAIASFGDWAFRAFFLFMLLNAGVFFVQNAAKWLGAAFCLALVLLWTHQTRMAHRAKA